MANCGRCGESGHNSRTCTGFAVYHCRGCGNTFRVNGNGGLVLGTFPDCPRCGNYVEMVESDGPLWT